MKQLNGKIRYSGHSQASNIPMRFFYPSIGYFTPPMHPSPQASNLSADSAEG